MKNHIIACRYEKSTGKFDNHVFQCSDKNEHVDKELKVYSFVTVINENITKITYRKWDFME